MKPQKRSIRDFFTPVSQTPRATPRDTPQLQDTSSASASPLSRETTSLHQDSAPLTINTATAPAGQNTSAPPPAPASFSATPANAQPPTTSQTSANSGASKRVVSNGEQVVLNSDSDDDSLPDLDWGQPTTSLNTATPTTRSKRTTQHDDDDGLHKPERKRGSKKRPFDQVLDTVQKNKEIEQRIVEHKADFERVEKHVPVTYFALNEAALGKAIEDGHDPDKAHRLLLAMQRTNATQVESVYHLFRDTSDSIAIRSHASIRDQAFMSGFAHQVFRLQELPQELASWMIDQICLEPSEALDFRYLEILEGHHQYLQTLLDRNRLDAIFRSIGGDVNSLGSGGQLEPTFDARPEADMDLLGHVQSAIEAIICNFADSQKLTQGVGSPPFSDEAQTLIISQLSDFVPPIVSRVTHPTLQRNLVRAFPSRSPLTSYLQRHLALSFLLYPTVLVLPMTDDKLPRIVHEHLDTSPNFRINKETDYGSLAARMFLLDIAIGPGLSSVPYQPVVSPAPSQSGSSPIIAPYPASSEIKEFNSIVDALTQHIKIMGNSIVEAGAVVDLTILEAKDSVERLCARLEHAVRIGGKKHHDIFGADNEDKQLRVTDIFRKAAKARKAAPAAGIFDNAGDNDDEAAATQLRDELAL
ncbi:hypothetical protein EK21DRAFT_102465 [Setomelanomma holmii]|uniref:Uncharacterized protein n=1 Tax=Setomelanomma holmii TaxID=210430 RepID=A0A9P4H5B8_9PLEO|nr:hypothetical protein EK21DRAFT_102465 [Setomelanomma holmii]